MRDLHVTAEVLDRFARGDLDDAGLSTVLEHLENCETCAQRGQEHAANDLGALRAEMTRPQTVDRRRAFIWTIAAAAAIAIAVSSVLLVPKQRTSPRDPVPRVTVSPPIAATQPTTTTRASGNPEWQRAVREAVSSGRLPFPKDLEELSAPDDTVRGGTGVEERLAPAGVVVDDVRPAFQWPARENGTYTVFVFDRDRKVMQSPPLKRTTWTPDRDLPRARTLTWQVEVTGADLFETIPSPPSPPARFRIVNERDHEELHEVRAQHRDDALLLAVLYARSGMRDEALDALRRAAANDPDAKRILDRETSRTR